MATHIERRQAISTLLDAGKTPTEIVKELQCSRHVVYTVKNLKKAGKDLDLTRRRYNRPVLTPTVRAGIKRRVKTAPTKSLRKVAKEAGVNREIVRRVVVEAGRKSLRKVKVPLISAAGREKRRV